MFIVWLAESYPKIVCVLKWERQQLLMSTHAAQIWTGSGPDRASTLYNFLLISLNTCSEMNTHVLCWSPIIEAPTTVFVLKLLIIHITLWYTPLVTRTWMNGYVEYLCKNRLCRKSKRTFQDAVVCNRTDIHADVNKLRLLWEEGGNWIKMLKKTWMRSVTGLNILLRRLAWETGFKNMSTKLMKFMPYETTVVS